MLAAGVLSSCEFPLASGVPGDLQLLTQFADGIPVDTELVLSFQLDDVAGVGLPDITVKWEVVNSDGEVVLYSLISDADGRVAAPWYVGTRAGEAAITANVNGLSPRDFQVAIRPTAPATLELATDEIRFTALGSQATIVAVALDEFGNTPAESLEWSSSNPAVATVTPAGLVVANSVGEATIEVTVGSLTQSASVTVEQVPAFLEILPEQVLLSGVGETEMLTAQATDSNGNAIPLTNQDVQWDSPDPQVAVVDADGEVTAVGPGEGEVGGTLGSLRSVVFVTVAGEPSLADPDHSTVTATPSAITSDGSSTVVVQLRDAAGFALETGGDQVFLTTDLGALGSAGGATGPGGSFSTTLSSAAEGTATITAYLGTSEAGALIGTAIVEVTEGTADAENSTIEASPTSMTSAETSLITVQLKDAQGDNLTTGGDFVSLVSDDGVLLQGESLLEGGGTTNPNGVFTASLRVAGAATITVTAYLGPDASGPEIGTATVEVTQKLARVELDPTEVKLTSVGATTTLTATAIDTGAWVIPTTPVTFTWTTSDAAVATVDASGTVTARGVGTAVITAGLDGKSAGAEVTVKMSDEEFAAMLLHNLLNLVQSMNLGGSFTNPLTSAIASLEDGDVGTALGQLGAFKNQVSAPGQGVPTEVKILLHGMADSVMGFLGGVSVGAIADLAADDLVGALSGLHSKVVGAAGLGGDAKAVLVDALESAIDAFESVDLSGGIAELGSFLDALHNADVQAQLSSEDANHFDLVARLAIGLAEFAVQFLEF